MGDKATCGDFGGRTKSGEPCGQPVASGRCRFHPVEGEGGDDELSDAERRFVEEYCVDFNATQAAVRAGYSEKTAAQMGYKLVHKSSDVRDALRERLDEMSMSAEEALYRLSEQGRNVQMRYLQDDGTFDLAALIEDGLGHLVKGTKRNAQGALIIEFHDAQAAIKEIAKIRGLLGPSGSERDPIHHAVRIQRVNEPPAEDGPDDE